MLGADPRRCRFPDSVVWMARRLRRKGRSYAEIGRIFGAHEVTVRGWCTTDRRRPLYHVDPALGQVMSQRACRQGTTSVFLRAGEPVVISTRARGRENPRL